LFRTRMIAGKTRISFRDSRILPITGDWINNLVVHAAVKIGIQSYTETRKGKHQAFVHAHSGRTYFKKQLRLAGVDTDLRDFLMGHKLAYDGAYDKFSPQEIIAAMEQARQRLMLTPEPTSELERNKQMALMATKILRLPDVERTRLEQIILQAQSTEELNRALDEFNGGEKRK